MTAAPDPTFDELVSVHRRGVFRLCRSILRDDHLGSDAAQETFLKLWSAFSAGDVPDRGGAWLRRVAVTTALDLARRREARGRAEDQVADRGRSQCASGPAERASLVELEERLERGLARLSEKQRTVFLLRHEGGLSLREVAEALSVALPTARTQFARACLKLQEQLSSYDPKNESETR